MRLMSEVVASTELGDLIGKTKTVMDATKIDHCKHVMALTLVPNKTAKVHEAVVRLITGRDGDVDIEGFVDTSELSRASLGKDGTFQLSKLLKISNSDAVINSLKQPGEELLGLEDPDCWEDPETGLLHLYFTIALHSSINSQTRVYLGHAEGDDIEHLTMTEPVLSSIEGCGAVVGTKEVCIPPPSSNGARNYLIEGSADRYGNIFSVVQLAIGNQPGPPWELGPIVLHPVDTGIPYWCSGHASPAPLFAREFIDVGQNKCVGFLNGREPNRIEDNQTFLGEFAVGLFVYDYEQGKIEWVSQKPVLKDPLACKGITFASCLHITGDEAHLYAHTDDSFIRSYQIKKKSLREYLSKHYSQK